MKSNFLGKASICLLLLLTFPILSPQLFSQIEVEQAGPIFNAENLITSVFLGDGVEVTNIDFQGDENALGYFTNGFNDVGIGRGLVMSSGNASTAATPNNAGGTSDNTNGGTSDQFLDEIASLGLNNVARYTITFVPIADTLRFRYTFASEEYPEYACSNFNDVFGFFIYGPGINGGFPNNAENIALVPDPADPTGLTFTDWPVAINNVNPGVVGGNGMLENCTPPDGTLDFSDYYNDNANSATLTFDGYTDVFTAQAVVTPCQEYTIVLAIADVNDPLFDSAVFLEAKSFGTGSLQVEAATVSLDGTITEGCSDGTLSFSLPSVVESDFPIDYTIFGTAENGVDYELISENLFIPAGSNSVSVPVVAIEDDLFEGAESIGIDVQRDPCNRDTFFFFIRDNDILPSDLGDTTICRGDSVYLDATLPIVQPEPPTFENNTDFPIVNIFQNNPPPPGTDPTQSPIQVFGVQPSIINEETIKRICIDVDHKFIGDVDVFLMSPGGQIMELTTDNGASGDNYTQTCFTPVATDTIDFGSQAPKEAAPFTGDWHPEGVWSDLWDGENPTNGVWQLILKDDSMGFDGTLLGWSICFQPLYRVFYSWFPTTGLTCADCPDPIASPDVSTTYVVTATDIYGCVVEDSVHIEVLDVLPAPDVQCTNITTNSIDFEWTALAGATGGYEVNIDGTGWVPASGGLSHQVNNLSLGQSVSIEVRGLANCDGTIGTVTCMVPNCTPPQGTISSVTNVSCNGGMDGSLTINGTGANPPFEYSLNGMSNQTGTFAALPQGTYSVIVTDALDCASSVQVIITEPDPISSQGILLNNASCNGGTDASITVEVNGGSQPYSFDWNLSNTDSIQNSLPIGLYYVTITDGMGCTTLDSVAVTEPDLITLSTQVTSVSCNGLDDGTATVLVNGGTGPFSYVWDANVNDQIDSLANSLTAGTYFVTVTDALGCTQSTAAQVFENPAIDLSITGINPDCNGAATGSATVVANGGAGNFSYLWNDGTNQTTATANLLSMGDYTVTVTDIDGCSQSIDINLSEPAGLVIATQTDSVSCFGLLDGAAVLTVNGGSYPYTYSWSDDPTTTDSTRNDLSAGMVQVTITDGLGCSSSVDLDILEPSAIAITTDSNPITCFGANDGMVSATVNGGNGNFTFSWDGPGGNSPSLNGLSAGIYTVTVLDANNCSVTASAIVNEPTEIILDTQVSAICNGASNGSAMVLPQGGTSPYTFQWDNNANDQTSQEASNLIAGTYFVTVTDAMGCSQSISTEVFESPAIDLGIVGTNLMCNNAGDGTATVSTLGGTPPYTYLWSDASNQTTETATGLAAGQYTVTVSDQGACTQEISIAINEPDAIDISEQSTAVNCFGGTDGTAVLEVNGGVYPYTYIWSDNAMASDSTRANLSVGIVTATVTDANGCSNTINININEPAPIQLLSDNEPVACNGGNSGTATIIANGGSGNYTYEWDDQTNNQTTSTASGLPSGTFFVTVTDDQGCSASLGVDVLQATSVSIDETTEDVICFGANDGSIVLAVDGGNDPYTYQWEGPNGFVANAETIDDLFAGTYFVTITDSNNCMTFDQFDIDQPASTISSTMSPPDSVCFGASNGAATVTANGGTGALTYNWSFNNQNTANITSLPAGEHYVTITDMQGCSWIDTALIVERPEIELQISQTPPLCFNGNDGTAQIDAILENGNSGDINSYTFNWTNGQTTFNTAQLVGGQTYTVIATATNGCTATASISIDNPAEIGAALISTVPVSCNNGNDGSITVSGTGGTTPYTYLWNDAAAQNSETAADLSAGEYRVTVTDANGCTTSLPFVLNTPSAMAVDFRVSDVLCPGDANGRIEAIVVGGNAPYDYLWSSGDATSGVDSVVAGIYELTITDANGCVLIQSEVIDAPDVLQANLTLEELSCFDSRNGRITIEPTGGVAPYRYSMNGIDYDGSPVRIGLTAGNYDLYIQDANGCTWQSSSEILNPPAVEVDPGEDLQMELGDSLQLSAEVFNTVGDYQLTWSAPYLGTLSCDPDTLTSCEMPWTHTQNTITYTVSAVDANGCYGEADIKVEVLKPRPVHVPTAFTPNADNTNDRLLIHGKPGSQVLVFQVFDRWGELVYQSGGFEVNNEALGWDGNYRGKEMNTGVYIWYAEVEFLDGRKEAFQGNTTLLR